MNVNQLTFKRNLARLDDYVVENLSSMFENSEEVENVLSSIGYSMLEKCNLKNISAGFIPKRTSISSDNKNNKRLRSPYEIISTRLLQITKISLKYDSCADEILRVFDRLQGDNEGICDTVRVETRVEIYLEQFGKLPTKEALEKIVRRAF